MVMKPVLKPVFEQISNIGPNRIPKHYSQEQIDRIKSNCKKVSGISASGKQTLIFSVRQSHCVSHL